MLDVIDLVLADRDALTPEEKGNMQKSHNQCGKCAPCLRPAVIETPPSIRLDSEKFVRMRRSKKETALCSARFDISPRAVYE